MMDKKSFLYKFRRKAQVNMTKIVGYEFMSKFYYSIIFKRKLNLKNPVFFNEKIHWLKLNYFPKNKQVIQATDKYKVREFLKNKHMDQYLNNLIGVWDSWQEVNWEQLPQKFVLKCNHGARYNIIVDDKSKFNKDDVGRQISQWMNEDFSLYNSEVHYSSIERKIICEEYLGNDMVDYKFFCFHGEPKFFYVAKGFGEGDNEEMAFFNMDGSRAPFVRTQYEEFSGEIILPESISDMINISKKLASDFPFVRVDFFEVNNKIIFSEMTFTPGGGLMTLKPKKYYEVFGNYLDLSGLIK